MTENSGVVTAEVEVQPKPKVEPQPEAESLKLIPIDQLKARDRRIDELEKSVERERNTRRQAELMTAADKFKALPVKRDEYAANMQKLERLDPMLIAWFSDQFVALDHALVEAGMMRELGSGRMGESDPKAKFISLVDSRVKDKYDGDKSKYTLALAEVSAENPELAATYAA